MRILGLLIRRLCSVDGGYKFKLGDGVHFICCIRNFGKYHPFFLILLCSGIVLLLQYKNTNEVGCIIFSYCGEFSCSLVSIQCIPKALGIQGIIPGRQFTLKPSVPVPSTVCKFNRGGTKFNITQIKTQEA